MNSTPVETNPIETEPVPVHANEGIERILKALKNLDPADLPEIK